MRRRRYAYGYQGNALQQPEPKMNFFQAIFSFVFGDGDPNLDWEERRWQTVGVSPRLLSTVLQQQRICAGTACNFAVQTSCYHSSELAATRTTLVRMLTG
jgi:hypothetical protein